ncbi:hypothetical protein [Burkholderia ubonensis]|uniref:hypothetical protein n=1 Tax=Burkholderia ubonensis TaxID=101571 RepID=UPI0018DF1BEB|nr:hypothetical protein [Burkholderia ubonensis]
MVVSFEARRVFSMCFKRASYSGSQSPMPVTNIGDCSGKEMTDCVLEKLNSRGERPDSSKAQRLARRTSAGHIKLKRRTFLLGSAGAAGVLAIGWRYPRIA